MSMSVQQCPSACLSQLLCLCRYAGVSCVNVGTTMSICMLDSVVVSVSVKKGKKHYCFASNLNSSGLIPVAPPFTSEEQKGERKGKNGRKGSVVMYVIFLPPMHDVTHPLLCLK